MTPLTYSLTMAVILCLLFATLFGGLIAEAVLHWHRCRKLRRMSVWQAKQLAAGKIVQI